MPELKGAFSRVNRADKRLAEFVALQSSHRLDQYGTVTVYKHPQSGYYVPQAVYSGPPISDEFSITIGEIIYNLRAALDYLVYELAFLDSGIIQEMTQFPIETNSSLFDSHRPSYLKGVADKHAAIIERLQPYNPFAWTHTVRDISNPDKHRHLTVVGGGGSGNFVVHHGPKG